MTLSVKVVLVVAAIIFFILSGLNIPKYQWWCFGVACWLLASVVTV